jgi:inorganic triphosphatase YgiF
MAVESSAQVETELKLRGDPELLLQLWQAPPLRRAQAAPPRVKDLENVYYDTADLRLRKRGLAFRIRRDGARFIQTVKTGDTAASAVLSRGEWEREVPSLEPQPDLVDDPAIRAALGLLLPGELRPVFTTRVHREVMELNGTDSLGRLKVIEAAFDRGEIEAAGAREALAEIELELIEGPPGALFDLALALQDISPTRIETRSKSARGYALATGRRPAWVRAEALDLKAEMPVSDALAAVLGTCLRHWCANEAAAVDGSDPEGVHQMRVGLRRFRSALALFDDLLPADQAEWLKHEGKWALDCLGPTGTSSSPTCWRPWKPTGPATTTSPRCALPRAFGSPRLTRSCATLWRRRATPASCCASAAGWKTAAGVAPNSPPRRRRLSLSRW